MGGGCSSSSSSSSSDPPSPRRVAARGSLLEVRNREREESGGEEIPGPSGVRNENGGEGESVKIFPPSASSIRG